MFSGKVGLSSRCFFSWQLYVGLFRRTDMKHFKFCFSTRRGRARRDVLNVVCPNVTERLVQEVKFYVYILKVEIYLI